MAGSELLAGDAADIGDHGHKTCFNTFCQFTEDKMGLKSNSYYACLFMKACSNTGKLESVSCQGYVRWGRLVTESLACNKNRANLFG